MKLIPTPKKITVLDNTCLPGYVTADKRFGAAADAYDGYRKILFGEITDSAPVKAVYADNVAPGGYSIRCGEEIVVYASDNEGANNAFATLLQLAAEGCDGTIQAVDVDDEPDCEYRGLMIDLARIWHPFDYLLRYVDLCRYYKLSTLHLHFTDSQSYTLPCDSYPKLPTPGRSYTKEQIKELCRYACARGIDIMPEIDVPGHCTPFISAYPELFGHGGIIGFHADVFEAFEKIIKELCEMFPESKRIHIGGDEADIKQWLACEKCRDYAEKCGIPVDDDARLSSERILAVFVAKLSQFVLDNGKIPVVWEGFCKDVNYLVPRTTQVFSWENYYQTTPQLVEAGYTLINGSWSPNYIVAPNVMWSVKECFWWNIFLFRPVHPESPYINSTLKIEPYDKMIGGQLLSWGDFGASSENPARHLLTEWQLVSERAAAIAENTWNIEKRVIWEQFSEAHAVQNSAVNRIFNNITLKTEHLVLRQLKTSDFERVHSYCSVYENVQYMLFGPNTEDDTRKFIGQCIADGGKAPRLQYDFAVELDGKLIGTCGIYVRSALKDGVLGWILDREYHNKGYMTEAAKELMRFGFEELGLHRITADCYTENAASRRVMEKIGMRREGEYKKSRPGRPCDAPIKWFDEYLYAILDEEYFAK